MTVLDPLALFVRATWMDDANCRRMGPGLFYDWETQRPERSEHTLALAVSVCHECDVQTECLAYALTTLDPTHDLGVWGGTTRDERRAMRSTRKAT